ncbi:hypothetical protein EAG_01343 [Camponotus floridanus]|uniref:Uncharacterized protein n=1 Tax=Camponotus floridanus TaxID=104421 RepID=E2B0K2_CAMFO|nr:hypothetical protein EAG_01343 [Camponotus floridanus]
MSDTSYPASSEELSDDRDEVPCGPPLLHDRFERVCLRVYSNNPLSFVLDVNLGERVVYEVVPYQRDTLYWFWGFLDIFQVQKTQEFVALWGRRRFQRLLMLDESSYRLFVVPLPRLLERMPPIGCGHGRSPG